MVTTTLKKLREAGACRDRYEHLAGALGSNYGDNTPIPLVKILEANGLDDVLWIPRSAVAGEYVDMCYRLFAVACCQDVLHLMSDRRSRDAVKAAHLYAYGEVGDEEFASAVYAASAAWAATWAAGAAAKRQQAAHFMVIFSADFNG